MESITLTPVMIMVLMLLGFTIFLFISEIIRVDLAAILVLVVLGLLSTIPSFESLADINHLFDGFASNAVISIIAVMIIGAGLDKTGLMSKLAAWILKTGGTTETRIIPIVAGTAGFIFSTHRITTQSSADADGVLCNFGRHHDNGGFLAFNSSQRPFDERQYRAITRSTDTTLLIV